MYFAEYRWIRKPIPVTTSVKMLVRWSITNPSSTLNPPLANQVKSGAGAMRSSPPCSAKKACTESMNGMKVARQAMPAMVPSENRRPKRPLMAAPSKGNSTIR